MMYTHLQLQVALPAVIVMWVDQVTPDSRHVIIENSIRLFSDDSGSQYFHWKFPYFKDIFGNFDALRKFLSK